MRKIFYFVSVALAALFLSSCNDNAQPEVAGGNAEKASVSFSAITRSSDTRAASAPADEGVSKLEFFVFRPDGSLDAYGSTTKNEAVTLLCSKMDGMSVVAVVNSASSAGLSSVVSKDALLAKVSYLKDNVSAYEMIGTKSVDLSKTSSVEVDVRRFAALVELDGITNSLPDAYKDSFKVTAVYLINVNNQSSYNLSTTPGAASGWYNQGKYVSGEANALIYDSVASASQQIAAGATNSTKHYFLAYSNNTTTDSSAAQYCARYTRLVIETSIGGKTYYYPINIINDSKIDDERPAGVLSFNTKYVVTGLTIKGLGNDDIIGPDVPIVKGDVSYSIKIEAWKTGFSKQITM